MSRGLRNNNPGNIRHDGTRWQGERVPSTDRAFKQFTSMAYGYRAMFKLLTNYARLHGCQTIRKIISRWAPPSENDTAAYIATVSRLTGIAPDQTIDIASHDQMCSLVAAMSQVENGIRAAPADIQLGWLLLS